MSATLIYGGVPPGFESEAPTLPFLPRVETRRMARGTTSTGGQFGRYEIHEQVGTGGMGTVHRAEVVENGERRTVAIKRLRPDTAREPAVVDAFVREAELAQGLDHPNIARIHAYGSVDGTHFIEMEYVEGKSLFQLIKRVHGAGESIAIAYALDVLIQLCDALDHAHGLGIVHRDVSPSNVILSDDGRVKLIDFGVAKAKHSKHRTRAGVIKGKLAYLAPEYVTKNLIDHRADLFALGVIAHELLTGRPLFHATGDVAIMENICRMPIQPPSFYRADVSPELDDIVMSALSRDPETRWQSAAAMARALRAELAARSTVQRAFADTLPPASDPPERPVRVDSFVARASILTIATAITALAVTAFLH